ncbi:macrophage mannose receptor 1-like [Erpetoichthys calabaricus]|uniref:macrophage mannose receptor 1-like n=1 Tax=Erpetoichthys calabaricus TaxID=27687 RepID=UPI0022346A84|nr:macrophage mannose receptor 1-like [Erpetoichthys calabaricus]
MPHQEDVVYSDVRVAKPKGEKKKRKKAPDTPAEDEVTYSDLRFLKGDGQTQRSQKSKTTPDPELTYAQVEWGQARRKQRSQKESPAATDQQSNKGSGRTAFSLRFRLLIVLLVVTLGLAASVIYLVLRDNKSDGGGDQEIPLNLQGNKSLTKHEDTTQAASHNTKGSPNENSFTTLGNNSYYFSTEKKDWKNSRDFCAQHQTTLVVFLDKEEQNKVTQHIKSLAVQGDYWIGLKKNDSGWHWVDGTLLASQRFPLDNSNSAECCATLTGVGLKPSVCAMTNKWICEKSTDNKSDGGGNQEIPLNLQGNKSLTQHEDTTQAASHNTKGFPNENSFMTLGNNSYYFSTEKKVWKNSRDFCAQHQTTLAVFLDKEEQNKVTQHIKSLAVQGAYWIGLKKNESGWHWVDGTLLDSQRFPLDNSNSAECCAMLTGDGLKPSVCAMTIKWICEKSTGGSGKGRG